MREMSTENTTQYLERLIKTEMSLRNMRDLKTKIDKRASFLESELNLLNNKPSRNQIKKPFYNPPKEPQKPADLQKQRPNLARHSTLLGWAIEGIGTASTNNRRKQEHETALAKYETDIVKYQQDLKDYEIKYQKEMNDYNNKVAEANAADEKIKKDHPIAISKQKEASAVLESNIKETEDVLQKLYDLDVVFPKYRELVALCSMYEYFLTGRVSELKGPDGAYNLFEAELRQNLIITELRNINDQLEAIKQNQYVLYSELKKSNEYLAGISATLTATLETVSRIADAAELNNLLTANMAHNVEAIKYISLIN